MHEVYPSPERGVSHGVDEVTVGDLFAWEPRFTLVVDGPGRTARRAVSWVVAARTLPPALPTLRGGEVILLTQAMLAEPGRVIQPLLQELGLQRIAAVVVDEPPDQFAGLRGIAPVPVLCIRRAVVNVELESELNRLLTEARGEIYRRGTELGRLMSSLTASGASLRQVLEAGRDELSMPLVVTDRHGVVFAAAGESNVNESDLTGLAPAGDDPDVIEHPLRGGGRLWVGPVEPRRHALARAAAERLAGAIEATLSGANWFRARGAERGEALATFITGTASRDGSEARIQAVALGLDPTAAFKVVLASSPAAIQAFHRSFAPYGTVHEVAAIKGHTALLAELKSARAGTVPGDLPARRSALVPQPGRKDCDWIAISGPATSLGDLSEAARQAVYVAELCRAGLIRRSCVRFDCPAELGGFRLLYEFWGTPRLASFANDILGELGAQDRNGVLRQTLLHFLESGGSRVDAAERAAIHRNTLAYRLRRISELTRLDPNEPGDRLSLHLAVLAASIPPPR